MPDSGGDALAALADLAGRHMTQNDVYRWMTVDPEIVLALVKIAQRLKAMTYTATREGLDYDAYIDAMAGEVVLSRAALAELERVFLSDMS